MIMPVVVLPLPIWQLNIRAAPATTAMPSMPHQPAVVI